MRASERQEKLKALGAAEPARSVLPARSGAPFPPQFKRSAAGPRPSPVRVQSRDSGAPPAAAPRRPPTPRARRAVPGASADRAAGTYRAAGAGASAAGRASARAACGRCPGSLSSPPWPPRAPRRSAARCAAASPSACLLWAERMPGSRRRPEGARSEPCPLRPPGLGPGPGRAACPAPGAPRLRRGRPLGPRRAAAADCSTDPCGRGTAGAARGTRAGWAPRAAWFPRPVRPAPLRRGERGLHLDPVQRCRPPAAGRRCGRPGPRATAPHCPRGPFCIFRWVQGVAAALAGDHLITPRAGQADGPQRARPRYRKCCRRSSPRYRKYSWLSLP